MAYTACTMGQQKVCQADFLSATISRSKGKAAKARTAETLGNEVKASRPPRSWSENSSITAQMHRMAVNRPRIACISAAKATKSLGSCPWDGAHHSLLKCPGTAKTIGWVHEGNQVLYQQKELKKTYLTKDRKKESF